MPAPKTPNTAAATAAVRRRGDETAARRLREHGWLVVPPEALTEKDVSMDSFDHLEAVQRHMTAAEAAIVEDDGSGQQAADACAVGANTRASFLARARAESARVVLAEILDWAPSDDTSEQDLAAAVKVLDIFVQGQESGAQRWKSRADTFREGAA
jgi:hypothetical protein